MAADVLLLNDPKNDEIDTDTNNFIFPTPCVASVTVQLSNVFDATFYYYSLGILRVQVECTPTIQGSY